MMLIDLALIATGKIGIKAYLCFIYGVCDLFIAIGLFLGRNKDDFHIYFGIALIASFIIYVLLGYFGCVKAKKEETS